MKKIILGLKLGMSQVIKENGEVVPVTAVQIMDNMVLDVLNSDSDGAGMVLGVGSIKEKKLSKPMKGQFDRYKKGYFKYIKNYKLDDAGGFKAGSPLSLDMFEKDERVSVRGRTIGKGFAGTIKRHNFSRGPMTHGSKNHRQPGSLGGGTDPGRVFKGTRMGGRMGNVYRTVKNLCIVEVDKESSVLYIKGALPGKVSLVEIFN